MFLAQKMDIYGFLNSKYFVLNSQFFVRFLVASVKFIY